MRQYAKAKDVHRRMRALLWPLLASSWSKRPGYTCAFTRDGFVLWVQPHSFGDSLSGSQLTINLNQSTSHEIAHGCRILAYLDQDSRGVGARIEERILARLPDVESDVRVEQQLWETHQDIWLRYFAQDDLDEWAEFLQPRLDRLISVAQLAIAPNKSFKPMPLRGTA